ncbi:MAG: ABC transporter ATP-binding protein [Clostridia bacterium]|nr:ABC transporter ATP-binding protein [Clostridia bacterium]
MKNKKEVSLKKFCKNTVRGFKLCYKIYGKFYVWNIISAFVSQFTPLFTLYMSSLVVDSLAESKDIDYLLKLALIAVLGQFGLMLVQRIIRRQVNVYGSDQWRMDTLYYLKVQNNMQYAHLEDNDIRMKYETIMTNKYATSAGVARFLWLSTTAISHITRIILSVTLSVSLFTTFSDNSYDGFLGFVNSPYAAIFLIVLIISNVVVSVYTNNTSAKKMENEFRSLAKSNVIYSAYGKIKGNDMAIFGMNKIISREFDKMKKPVYVERTKRIAIRYGAFETVWNYIVTALLFIFIGAKVYVGAIGIGSFILYNGTVSKFITSVAGVAAMVGKLIMNNVHLENTFEYINLSNDMYKGSLSVEKRDDINYEIEFRNVSFKYPGTDKYVLKNVSTKFDIGKKLAIVGENGSGKTTFVKLLCRLYDPDEGKILLNGIDITKYKYDEYIRIMSVVFQDYNLFSFSVAHNISAELDYDKEKVLSCIEKVGLTDRISQLEKGVDACINRDYENDGVDFSGGESQKLAIARALYKDSPFIILDEPTAALDPLAEAEIYSHFNTIVDNKTAIFISHRLSSCRFCDNILVFHNGEIIEEGNHDTLVSNENGKYFELWNAQAKYYKDEE